ncbi:MAG TPA: hypothetical protein VN408_42560 [Actinoplanes sp.]|nr:hypothetical protein [Actinoplanes sp.]
MAADRPSPARRSGSAAGGHVDGTLLDWNRGRFATMGLPPLDEDDDPLEFAVFEAWTDGSYW